MNSQLNFRHCRLRNWLYRDRHVVTVVIQARVAVVRVELSVADIAEATSTPTTHVAAAVRALNDPAACAASPLPGLCHLTQKKKARVAGIIVIDRPYEWRGSSGGLTQILKAKQVGG